MIYKAGSKVENKLILLQERKFSALGNKSSKRTLFRNISADAIFLSVYLNPFLRPFCLLSTTTVQLCFKLHSLLFPRKHNTNGKNWGNCILCLELDMIQHTLPEEERNLITVWGGKSIEIGFYWVLVEKISCRFGGYFKWERNERNIPQLLGI